MQLILEIETSNIGIKNKMSSLEQESLSEKLIINGNTIQIPSGDVPNGNKENIIVKDNIIDDCKKNVSLNHDDKLITSEEITTVSGGVSSAEINNDHPEVRDNVIYENSISNIDNSTSEDKDINDITSNGEVNEESHSDNVPEMEVNKSDQQLVSKQIEKEDINPAETIEISEEKINDVEVIQEKNEYLERKETPLVAKEEERNILEKQVDIEKKEVELEKIIKLEQHLKEVDNSNKEDNLGDDVKANENESPTEKENVPEKVSIPGNDPDLRENISEPEANTINTESLEGNLSLDKNCSSTKMPSGCGGQTEIPTIESNLDTQHDDDSVDKASSVITKTLLDCGDQTETSAFKSNTTDTVDEVPNEITKTPLDCDDQTETIAIESNQDTQSNIDEVDQVPSEITITPLDGSTQAKTGDAMEISQDTQSNNNDVAIMLSETNNISDIPVECDEKKTETVTGESQNYSEGSMGCDTTMEVATSDIDTVAPKHVIVNETLLSYGTQTATLIVESSQDTRVDNNDIDKVSSETNIVSDIPMECDENDIETAPQNSKDYTDISMDYDKTKEVATSDVDTVAQSSDIVNKTPSICGSQTQTPIIESCQDPRANSNDVDKVSNEANAVSDSSIKCDESDTVTDKSKDYGDVSIDCDKAIKEATRRDVDIISQMPVQCDEITNETAEVKGTVTAIDCDNITNTNVTEVMDVVDSTADEGNDILPDDKNSDVTEEATCQNKNDAIETPVIETINEILDVDEIKMISDKQGEPVHKPELPPPQEKKTPTICRLSNTLDILSDDEDEPIIEKQCQSSTDKQCINIEDDDDIMLIDEDTPSKEDIKVTALTSVDNINGDSQPKSEKSTVTSVHSKENESCNESLTINEKESSVPATGCPEPIAKPEIIEKISENIVDKLETPKPLVPDNFFRSYKKNIADMTRDDLEDFCILKIVESIIDRSNLAEIRAKIKSMAQISEEYKKKATVLTKQNRDLQVVLKSVQEEQKKAGDSPIQPLKITRSVGMQVLMTDKNTRRKGPAPAPNTAGNNVTNRPARNVNQSPRQQPQLNISQQIPVPRLVPATSTMNAVVKSPNAGAQVNSAKNAGKTTSPLNGMRVLPQIPQKSAEKRPHNKMLTVDLTDDEPPAKVPAKVPPAPPVRLVPPQNLLAPRQPLSQSQPVNSPRKVYIPISGPQGQNVRSGQTILLKGVPPPGPRHRGPIAPMVRLPQNSVRMGRVQSTRHPAPLPESMKQYQPPNWKALPPAPDLKLSKVENGIVISWKIEGYQEDSYEEIASYQLYAYQETSSAPSTTLWKKIGDVKALPLPMACTLTQFMAGYKYYFAVRAVDVKSRLGPFSLPGSILLLNKM